MLDQEAIREALRPHMEEHALLIMMLLIAHGRQAAASGIGLTEWLNHVEAMLGEHHA